MFKPIKQGHAITASVDFEFKNPQTNRTIKVSKGSVWIVTNPVYNQKHIKAILIDRKKTAKLNLGYLFGCDDLRQFFSIDNLPPSYFGE
ncbi:MAG: hypothetical protein ACOVKJ_02660 [Flavobacterium sp.]